MNNVMKILDLYDRINANPKGPTYTRNICRVQSAANTRAPQPRDPFLVGTVRHSDR